MLNPSHLLGLCTLGSFKIFNTLFTYEIAIVKCKINIAPCEKKIVKKFCLYTFEADINTRVCLWDKCPDVDYT